MIIRILQRLKHILTAVPLPFYVAVLTLCALTGAYLESGPTPVVSQLAAHAGHTTAGAAKTAETTSQVATQDTTTSKPVTSGTGHTTTSQAPKTPSALPDLSKALTQQYQITASPAQLTLNVNTGNASLYISSATGKPFPAPSVSVPYQLYVTVPQSGPAPGTTAGKQQASWEVIVSSTDKSSGGEGTLTISTIAGQLQVPVKWSPVPAISVANTGVTSATGASTITYTVSFTLVGNSTVPTAPSGVYIELQAGGCTNPGDLRQYATFSGGSQNYTINCVMDIPPPYVPGSGYPPALGSGGFGGTVYVTVTPPSGSFIQGPSPFYVSAP